MTVTLSPYLNFRGNAREAMGFYESVFGGTLNVGTFADFGMPVDSAEAGLVMHAQLDTPVGLTLMGSDVPSHLPYTPGENTFSVALSGDDEAALTRFFDRLSEGGQVPQPLEKAPWGSTFGMLTDRFGVSWLVNIDGGATA